MADEVKHEHDNPTNWGQGLTGASVGVLALTELLKGIHGTGAIGGNTAAQAANTAVAMELAEAKSKISMLEQNAATRNALTDVLYAMDKRLTKVETEGPLREQIVLGQVQAVATQATSGISAVNAALQNIAATVGSITKCVVPNSAICPGWGGVTITPTGTGVIQGATAA